MEQAKALPFQPFQFHGFEGKRRVISFGWRYDFNGGGLQKTEDIPGIPAALARARGTSGRARAREPAARARHRVRRRRRHRLAQGPQCVRRHHRRRCSPPARSGCGGGQDTAGSGAAITLPPRSAYVLAGACAPIGSTAFLPSGAEILADLPQPQAASRRRRARPTHMARIQLLPKTSPADARLSVRSG